MTQEQEKEETNKQRKGEKNSGTATFVDGERKRRKANKINEKWKRVEGELKKKKKVARRRLM